MVDLAYLPGIAMTSVNVCSANKGNWESPLLGEPPAIPFPERTKGWVKTKAVGFLFLKSNRTSIYNGTKPLPKASGFSPGSQAGIWERRFYFFKRLNRYDCLPITSNNCNYQIRRWNILVKKYNVTKNKNNLKKGKPIVRLGRKAMGLQERRMPGRQIQSVKEFI